MFNCRKLPIVIQAEEWSGSTKTSFHDLDIFTRENTDNPGVILNYYIPTLEGLHDLTPGCYIIRGVDGEFYPCKKEIFEKTYERID